MYGDTVVARLILGAVAAVWSFLLFLPGDTFDRPVYTNMTMIAQEEVWASLWGVYSGMLLWRTLTDTPHSTAITMTINIVGVFLFGGTTAAIIFARIWPAPAAMAADVILTIVAVWLLMRSGINNPPGWRDD